MTCPEGEAKFWLDPVIALDRHVGLTEQQIKECQGIVEEHKDEIKKSWKKHFKN